MDRLGLGYETLKQVNPRLIYASVTAFGQDGPYAHWRGYDILAQALSGYMSITGFPDSPPTRSGQSISDYYAGMLCAFSIASALHYRPHGGKGQRIDMALLDSWLRLWKFGRTVHVGGEILTPMGKSRSPVRVRRLSDTDVIWRLRRLKQLFWRRSPIIGRLAGR